MDIFATKKEKILKPLYYKDFTYGHDFKLFNNNTLPNPLNLTFFDVDTQTLTYPATEKPYFDINKTLIDDNFVYEETRNKIFHNISPEKMQKYNIKNLTYKKQNGRLIFGYTLDEADINKDIENKVSNYYTNDTQQPNYKRYPKIIDPEKPKFRIDAPGHDFILDTDNTAVLLLGIYKQLSSLYKMKNRIMRFDQNPELFDDEETKSIMDDKENIDELNNILENRYEIITDLFDEHFDQFFATEKSKKFKIVFGGYRIKQNATHTEWIFQQFRDLNNSYYEDKKTALTFIVDSVYNYMNNYEFENDKYMFLFGLHFKFYYVIEKPISLSRMKEDSKLNCLLGLLKLPEKKIKHYNDLYFEKGVSEEEILTICKKERINIQVYDIFNTLWFESPELLKKKTYKILNHNEHATLVDNKKLKIEKEIIINDIFNLNVDNDSTEELIYENSNFEYINLLYKKEGIKQIINTNCFIIDNIKYIQKQKFHDFKDHDLYDFSDAGYYFKRLVQSEPETKEIYNFMRSCQLHTYKTPITINKNYNSTYYELDQNRSFTTSHEHESYNYYKFPTLPKHFYRNRNQPTSKLINLFGFCQVNNVKIKQNTCLTEYLTKTNYIYNLGIYPNNLLKFLYDYVTFDVITVCFSLTNQDIKFNPSDDKLINNSIVGRLTVNNQSSTKTYVVNNQQEAERLLYSNMQNITRFEHEIVDNVKYYYITISNLEREAKQYTYIKNYILGYNQIKQLEMLKTIKFNDIIKVNIDAIYTNKKYNNNKYFKSLEHTKILHITDNNAYPTHNNLPIDANYVSEDFEEFVLSNKHVMVLQGLAGSGKTFKSLNSNLYNKVMLSPTHALKDEIKSKYNIKAITFHKYYGLGTTYFKPDFNHSTVIIDELTLISQQLFENAIKLSKSQKIICLMGVDQLNPVSGLTINDKYLEHKKIDVIKLTTQMRAENKEYSDFITELHKLPNINDKINLIKKHTKKTDVKDIKINDIIITSTRNYKHYFNYMMLERCVKNKINTIPVIITNKQGVKQINIKDFKPESHELAFSYTAHKLQGSTISNNVIIHLNKVWTPEILNVSATRNTHLDNLYHLNTELDKVFDYDNNYHNNTNIYNAYINKIINLLK